MKRILVVAPMPSHPQNQGNSARLFALARAIKERGIALDLVYYGMEGLTDDQRRRHLAFWDGFDFVQALPHARMAHPDCWGIDDWCPDELCEVVAAKVRQGGYGAVLVNYVWMSKVFDGFSGPAKILDTHDLFSDRHLTAAAAGLEARWFFTTPAEESRGFDRADIVVAIQSNEEAVIRTRTKASVVTIGHYMTPNFLLGSYGPPTTVAHFGYIGSGNPWNVRSLETLDRQLVGQSRVRWAVAGTICRGNHVFRSNPVRLGLVDELEDFYNAVTCIINPMIGGTGLKIKTVEALSYGKPIVGTTSAFEGIPTDSEFHAVDDPTAFLPHMAELATNPLLVQRHEALSASIFLGYQATVQQQIDAMLSGL